MLSIITAAGILIYLSVVAVAAWLIEAPAKKMMKPIRPGAIVAAVERAIDKAKD